jgi:NTP pyrophosphatase (non-canonical NTP hydrolase)
MTMTANGLAKLIEECGELIQVAGKRLAYYHCSEHPDGAEPLPRRMESEMGDVYAAIMFVTKHHNLSMEAITARARQKLSLFEKWHADLSNNDAAIDRARMGESGE